MAEEKSKRENGRFSVHRKSEAILRLLRGEDLELLSREYGVTAARLNQWREDFLSAGQLGLKKRTQDPRDEQVSRLQAKVGELTMANELLEHKIDKVEDGRPFPRRRSKPCVKPARSPRAAATGCNECVRCVVLTDRRSIRIGFRIRRKVPSALPRGNEGRWDRARMKNW